MACSPSPWFDSGSGQDGSSWEEFVSLFESFCEDSSIPEEERAKKLLLHVDQTAAGVARALSDGSDSFPSLQKKLQSYFSSAERYRIRDFAFRSARQQEKEQLPDFISRLHSLAQRCSFKEKNKEVLLQAILGCSSEEIRQRALWDEQIEVHDLVAIERIASEMAYNKSDTRSCGLHSSQRDEDRTEGGDQQEEIGDDAKMTVTGEISRKTDVSSDVMKAGASADQPHTDLNIKNDRVMHHNRSCQTEERGVLQGPEKEGSWKEGRHVSQKGFLLVGGTPVSFSISFNSAAAVEAIDEERFSSLHTKSSPGARQNRGKREWKGRQEGNMRKKRNYLNQRQDASAEEPDQEMSLSIHADLGDQQTSGVAGDRESETGIERSQDEEGDKNSEDQQQSSPPGDENDAVSSIAEMFEGWGGEEGEKEPDHRVNQTQDPASQSADNGRTKIPAVAMENWESDAHTDSGHSRHWKWTRQSGTRDQSWFRQRRHHHHDALPWNYLDERENLVLFFGKQSPFSQHHACRFWMEEYEYNCTEQYMMYMKAAIAGDTETGKAILSTSNPARLKRLGSAVQGLDRLLWDRLCEDIVYRANWAKNPHLREALLGTRPKVLVEASPSDSQWGVGLAQDDPRAWCLKTWRGANRLGYILMQVREALAAQTTQKNWPLTSADQAYVQSAEEQWMQHSEGQWVEKSDHQQWTPIDQEQSREMTTDDQRWTAHSEEQRTEEQDATPVKQE